jgi:hypothetical protein
MSLRYVSSSKLVMKTVENSLVSINYFASGSVVLAYTFINHAFIQVSLLTTTVKRPLYLPSSQGRAHLDDSEGVLFVLNDLGPASWLQIREGRIQDLLLSRKCREPL